MSSAAPLLPPVPAPPHDPYSLVLDARAGWRIMGSPVGIEVAPPDSLAGEALALEPATGAARPLADAHGSFGGLTLPAWAALGPNGAGVTVLLLDRAASRLLRFDACACSFVRLPCIAGAGSKPRQLAGATGMIAACGNLFVCDAGNHRVQVFMLRGLVLRALWGSPPEAKLAQPWHPVAVAADARGRIFVGDDHNGRVHVISGTGRWLRSLDGLGAVQHLTFDCDGRLYVQVLGDPAVKVIDPDQWPDGGVESIERADEVADRFAPLPFPVTPDGHLRLGAACRAAGSEPAGDGDFDDHGAPVSATGELDLPVYQVGGELVTRALDAALHRCTWDRLELRGDFPARTMVRASAFTAETELPDDLISGLPPDAWSDCPALDGDAAVGDSWDCLLRATPGRFLWLRLRFEGDGHGTPRVSRVKLTFPRVSLRRYLPATFGADPVAAEFTDRLLGVFDRTLRGVESTIDWQARLFDPLSAPTGDARHDFLSWLATWIGVTLDRGWPEERRRRYLKQVGRLLPYRGTLDGLRAHLQLYLGLDRPAHCRPHGDVVAGERAAPCGPCTTEPPRTWQPPELVLEHYRLRRWMFLDHGRLGSQARLWGERIVNRSRLGGPHAGAGSARTGVTQLDVRQDPFRDPFHVYAHKFTVFAPAKLARSSGARRGLERLIRAERPAQTAFQVVYVEPRFRIGIQSMIGFDAAIGCYPGGGITLEEARLGKASVLSAGEAGTSTVSVGQQARIGTTTRLG